MLTLMRANTTPAARHRAYAWPFGEEFFRPLAEMVNFPMRTGVKETEEAFFFDAELPGYEPAEIDLSVQDGMMTIAAEHKEGNEDAPAFAAHSVRRSFSLGDVDEAAVSAQYKNGILRVTLPKCKAPDAPAARKIQVQ